MWGAAGACNRVFSQTRERPQGDGGSAELLQEGHLSVRRERGNLIGPGAKQVGHLFGRAVAETDPDGARRAQAPGMLESFRSRSAANARQARMSSRVSWGKSARTSSSLIPPAR